MDKSHTEADGVSSSADIEFNFLANSLAVFLEAAKGELEHNREAARKSLAAASRILHSEIERRSGVKGFQTGGLAGWQMARLRSFIDTNLHATMYARDLGAVVRLSTSHFARSFRRAFGEPPHAYIMRRRLDKACHLLLTSSDSLSDIALGVGFSDQAHFCKLFKRAFGQSPSHWRRDHEML
jgi:AraC family transcriptional regulator